MTPQIFRDSGPSLTMAERGERFFQIDARNRFGFQTLEVSMFSIKRKAKSSWPIAIAIAILSSPFWVSTVIAQDKVFDSHVHLHDAETSAAEYLKDVDGLDVKVAGFAAMWFGGGNQALKGHPAAIRMANDQAFAMAKTHAGMIPVVTVHPYDGRAAIAELERVAALGARVLKIHPHTQRFDAADRRVLTLVQRAGDLGVIVLMDNAGIVPGDNEKLFNLALAAPKTQFIFAHVGGLSFRFWNILHLIRTADNLFAENVHFDISATAVLMADSPLEAEFVWTLRNIGIDRILLGSDYPQFSLGDNVAALDKLDLTEDEKLRIRFGNAQKLFKLP